MKIDGFDFRIVKTIGAMRAGVLKTPHGIIETPTFMPVGTQAAVKALDRVDLTNLGAQIILGNTYHLHLRPGEKLIKSLGGLQGFTGWNMPWLTDSGGFQVSSLGLFKKKSGESMSQIGEAGVTFYSHLDGSKRFLSPEISIQIQEALGADIIMAFDEATPDKGKKYAREAMKRTHRWLARSISTWKRMENAKKRKPSQSLWGIIQGGNYADMRKVSAEWVMQQDLFGIALGGGSVGADDVETSKNIGWVKPHIPVEKPFYTMGVGVNPSAAVAAIKAGADMFDCVAPTRWARTGWLYTGKLVIPNHKLEKARFESEFNKDRLVIDKERFAKDGNVIDKDCDCMTCRQGYTRAYLHHLFKTKELTYYRLASIHNVRMMVRTVKLMREAMLSSM